MKIEELRALPLADAPLTVFDTETTGLDPWDEGHRVVSLAMVHATLDGAETRDVLSAVVDPERSVPAAAAAVHGLTDAWLAEQRAKGELPRWAEIQPRVAAGMLPRTLHCLRIAINPDQREVRHRKRRTRIAAAAICPVHHHRAFDRRECVDDLFDEDRNVRPGVGRYGALAHSDPA